MTSQQRCALVITSIQTPTSAVQELADGCLERNWQFYLIGDSKGPKTFKRDGVIFLDVAQQVQTGFSFARICPTGHYSRKNIGYLVAMRAGANVIVETDDDNLPYPNFWEPRKRHLENIDASMNAGWVNIYASFTDKQIWPRGFPLSYINQTAVRNEKVLLSSVDCPIHQGLADKNPDVDAIFRLIFPGETIFSKGQKVAIRTGSWCPFNSQNTTWWQDAFPLLYLPSFCSFRMTDIWRSFVAQRIAHENDWGICFHSPTMFQERNPHDLMKDFDQEISGYLNNEKIVDALIGLRLRGGRSALLDNLLACYEEIIRLGLIDKREIKLLEAWSSDIKAYVS